MRLTSWLGLAALFVTFVGATKTAADPDLWGHVRFGLDMLHTRTLPVRDAYSFTVDRPWINHEWLAEVQMGAAYAADGAAGLALLKAALVTVVLLLIWSGLGHARFEARLIAMGAAIVALAPMAQTLRPQLWSLLGTAVLCRLLLDGRARSLGWLPGLFGVWANLHGGWIVGLGILACWQTLDVIAAPSRRGSLVVIPASAVATLCNPYGWGLWRLLAESVRLSRPRIEEWQPLWALGPDRWIPWALGALAVAVVTTRPFAHRRATGVTLALLAYGSLRVARVTPLFLEAGIMLLTPWIIREWPSRSASIFGQAPRAERLMVGAVIIGATVMALVVLPRTLRCVTVGSETMPDRFVLDGLAMAPSGRLVTFFNWGEQVIWFAGPRVQVSMDGRRETVYSDARLADHDAILFGLPEAWPLLASWRPDYVWLPASSTSTQAWLVAHGYRLEIDTPRSFVAVRPDRPRWPTLPTDGPAACFPD